MSAKKLSLDQKVANFFENYATAETEVLYTTADGSIFTSYSAATSRSLTLEDDEIFDWYREEFED